MKRVRIAALVMATLGASAARATETIRIAIGVESSVVVLGEGLEVGADAEDAEFVSVSRGRAEVRADGGGLLVNGRRGAYSALRFRGRAVLRAGSWTVRGDLVASNVGGSVQLVNVVALEEYLVGVLASEMPPSFPDEALRAQAVAARTYALQKKLELFDAPYHLGSGVLSQVYGGHREGAEGVRVAVADTRGLVLTHDLAPIEAFFHASCGGRSESGYDALGKDLPYLQAVSCPCEQLPSSRWELLLPVQNAPSVSVLARTTTGRVKRLRIGGEVVDAVRWRARLGYSRLKSLDFRITKTEGGFHHLEGRGYGHGAGLCQWGAKVLAEMGWDHRRILSHYYPGTELQTLY